MAAKPTAAVASSASTTTSAGSSIAFCHRSRTASLGNGYLSGGNTWPKASNGGRLLDLQQQLGLAARGCPDAERRIHPPSLEVTVRRHRPDADVDRVCNGSSPVCSAL